MNVAELDGHHLTLETIEAVATGAQVRIGAAARKRVARARDFVDARFASGETIYGVTTGLGRLASVSVDPADAVALQINLVRSHAAGTGEPLAIPFVRAASVLRANSLSAGHSGVKPETLDLIVAMLERGVTPVVPCQGSVGASGDLAPLAHMTLTLIGEGEAFYRGERLPSAVALERAGLAADRSRRERRSGARQRHASHDRRSRRSVFCARNGLPRRPMSLARCRSKPTSEPNASSIAVSTICDRIPVRNESQRTCVRCSRVPRSCSRTLECDRVQDPYSFRCIPVVHGAVRDSLAHVRRVTEIEANSVTDNPLVFPEDGEFISGGNFHGEPIALVLDFLKFAVAELASIAERRLYLLLNGEDRGLPLFLAQRLGLESGLMIVQYTAAALVNDNKGLAWPSSVDSIPTSAGQEDHVSMGMTSANNLPRVLDNVEGALACELLGALAATDLRRPLKSGRGTQAAHEAARETIAAWSGDRAPAPDIAAARELIASHRLVTAAESAIGRQLSP